MEKVKIGQIGICHAHAWGKMEGLLSLPDVFEIVGVVDDRDTASARFGDESDKYKDLTFMTEEELLNTPGLQAVTVETPNDDLVPTALRCMKKGIAMHMDKPGGTDLGLFKTLLDGCEAGKVPFQMGYMFRNNPAIQFCIRAVRDKLIGEVFEIQADMHHNYGGEDYQEYVASFPGGMMFILGCHLIDFVVSMLGKPDHVIPFLKSAAGYREEIKNNCMVVLEYPHASAVLSSCSKAVDGLVNRHLKISGTKGTIELSPLERFDGEPLTMKINLLEDAGEYKAGTHEIDFGIKTNRYADQLNELAEIVRGEMANPYTYEHDYLVQKIFLAACEILDWS